MSDNAYVDLDKEFSARRPMRLMALLPWTHTQCTGNSVKRYR
jgi:hypothetical protein